MYRTSSTIATDPTLKSGPEVKSKFNYSILNSEILSYNNQSPHSLVYTMFGVPRYLEDCNGGGRYDLDSDSRADRASCSTLQISPRELTICLLYCS